MRGGVQGQRSLVWTLALLNTVAYGALYYAQPLLAMMVERMYGWTRLQTSLAFTLALLASAVAAPAVGRRLDARGGRHLLPLGALLGAGALLTLAWTSSVLVYTLAWLLAGLAMALTFYEATFPVLGQQLTGPARSAATLTVTLLAGLASPIFVPLTTALLGGGLRVTAVTLAGLLGVCAALLWRRVPPLPGAPAGPRGLPFRPDAAFRALTLVFTLTRVAMVGVGLQLVPLLLWSGYPPAVAAGLTGLMGLSALPGRALFVPLLGRLGALRLSLWVVGLLGLGSALLTLSRGPVMVTAALTVLGMMNGARASVRAELLMTHYPPALFGTVNGRMARVVNLAQAGTPLGAGWLFVAGEGSYVPSLVGITGLTVWAFLTLHALNRKSH